MKKVYTKPVVVIEKFETAEHIAACGDTTVANGNYMGTPNYADGIRCEFINGAAALFLHDNKECNIPIYEENEFGCYNTPSGEVSFFSS